MWAKADEAKDAVVELVSSVIRDQFDNFAVRNAISTPAVFAGLGVAGHQAMSWVEGDTISPDKFRELLTDIRWERKASYWAGIAGKATGRDEGISFPGGVKDSGGRVADAILYPHTQPGRKIRGEA
jgi:hypothetical protein